MFNNNNRLLIELNTDINDKMMEVASDLRNLKDTITDREEYAKEHTKLYRGYDALWACSDLMIAHMIAGEVYDDLATVLVEDDENEFEGRILKFLKIVDEDLKIEEIEKGTYIIYDDEAIDFEEAKEILGYYDENGCYQLY